MCPSLNLYNPVFFALWILGEKMRLNHGTSFLVDSRAIPLNISKLNFG